MEVMQRGLQPGSHDRWQHMKSGTKQMALDFKRGEIAFSEMPRVGSHNDSRRVCTAGTSVERVPQMQCWGRYAFFTDKLAHVANSQNCHMISQQILNVQMFLCSMIKRLPESASGRSRAQPTLYTLLDCPTLLNDFSIIYCRGVHMLN